MCVCVSSPFSIKIEYQKPSYIYFRSGPFRRRSFRLASLRHKEAVYVDSRHLLISERSVSDIDILDL